MKYLVLLLALACGKYETSGNPSLGQLIEYKPQALSESDKALQSSICEALESKHSRLSAMAGQSLSFGISESDCGGNSSETTNVNVRVAVNGSAISFERENGAFFLFANPETTRSAGIFASYCASDKMPFLHNGNAVWMNTNPSDACTRSNNVLCVNFKQGIKNPNSENSYRVSTEDSFALDMLRTSGRFGFYTHRSQRSNLGCETGSRVLRAKLN